MCKVFLFGRLGLSLILAFVAGVSTSKGQDGKVPLNVLNPIERLSPAHLNAAHVDVERIARLKQEIPPLPGLKDYRAIFHAHAEDSAHTGGTRPEMLADAKRVGVQAIFLSNHHRPPNDFIKESWRGLHEGVLFVPGSEDRGFLLSPTRSIMAHMSDPTPAFIKIVTEDDGLIFLSHIEERPDHSMAGLNGMEIYNRHADAKKDAAGIVSLFLKLTDPDSLRELEECLKRFPDEMLAAQSVYPADYLTKWDKETKTRRLTGVAANDCHHNQILIVKMVNAETVLVGTNVDDDKGMRTIKAALRPGIRALTKGHQPGDILGRLDFDPYFRSFQNGSTHLLATELSEPALRTALRKGHAYVSHDWMCDPKGFQWTLISPASDPPFLVMGDEVPFAPGLKLTARFPVPCKIRILNDGKVIAEQSGDRLEQAVTAAGVYRAEGWLEVGGEARPWIYSNPIYIR